MVARVAWTVVWLGGAALSACDGAGVRERPLTAHDAGVPGEPAEKRWGPRQLIENNPESIFTPQLVIDDEGNATVAWWQGEATGRDAWANRFVPATGWGAGTPIEALDGSVADVPRIAVDAHGVVTAIWLHTLNDAGFIYASRFTPGTGWSPAEPVGGPNTSGTPPNVAVDPAGNVTAVWARREGTGATMFAARFTPGPGWGAVETIGFDPVVEFEFESPLVVADVAGNVTAAWIQSFHDLWFNRFSAGAGWGTASQVTAGQVEELATLSSIGIDAAGTVTVLFHRSDAISAHVWANRFVPATGWQTPIQIDNAGGGTHSAKVAVNRAGNALAVWGQLDGAPVQEASAWGAHFVAGVGWEAPARVQGPGGFSQPEVAIDRAGNGMAVWNQMGELPEDSSRLSIWANRFVPGTGWGTPMLLETDDGQTGQPKVAFDPAGNAIAVWPQSYGFPGFGFPFDLYAAHYR